VAMCRQQVFSLPLPEPTTGTTRQKWYRQCFAATAFAFSPLIMFLSLNLMVFKIQDLKSYIDQRFQAVDHRFEGIDKRFTSVQWMMGIGFSMLGIIMVFWVFLVTYFISLYLSLSLRYVSDRSKARKIRCFTGA
jgi:glutathione S-transferase